MLTIIAAAAAAALLHPHTPAPPAPPSVDHPAGTKVFRHVIVREGDKAEAPAGVKRPFVLRRGEGELTLNDCEGGRRFETAAEGTKDGKKTETRIVLCGKKDGTDSSYAEVLDRAAKNIAADKELPADVRDRVVASINAEIARLNVSRN
jgi:hypothetical protein